MSCRARVCVETKQQNCRHKDRRGQWRRRCRLDAGAVQFKSPPTSAICLIWSVNCRLRLSTRITNSQRRQQQQRHISHSHLIYVYTVSQKNKTPNSCPWLHQMLTDFHNSFTVRLSTKFVTKSCTNTPPHPKRVATLPCEISVQKIAILKE